MFRAKPTAGYQKLVVTPWIKLLQGWMHRHEEKQPLNLWDWFVEKALPIVAYLVFGTQISQIELPILVYSWDQKQMSTHLSKVVQRFVRTFPKCDTIFVHLCIRLQAVSKLLIAPTLFLKPPKLCNGAERYARKSPNKIARSSRNLSTWLWHFVDLLPVHNYKGLKKLKRSILLRLLCMSVLGIGMLWKCSTSEYFRRRWRM